MKALLFEGLPGGQNIGGDHSTFASGTNVYREGVIKALFRYGTYDAYFFLQRTPFLSEKRDLDHLQHRARIITPKEIQQLDACDDVVLFTPVPYINSLVSLRSTPNAAHWIANGVVHSLDGWNFPFLPLSLLNSDVDEADSLLCSTRAGKEVVEKLFDAFSPSDGLITNKETIPVRPKRPSLPVIPLGIDCQAFGQVDRQKVRSSFGASENATIITYVGRISPISKCDLLPLFHVVARIFQSNPEIRLIIAGDDTQHHMAEFLESAAQVLGCGSCITILPDIDDDQKISLLNAADIFVSPSDNIQETFGLSIAEAMASALPVIASDWNGYRELVSHGETGFLIPTYWLPFDQALDGLASTSFRFRNAVLAASTIIDLDGLEHYLRLLIERPDLRKAMGQLGRRHALEKYDWSNIIKAYEDVWNDGSLKSKALRKGRSNFANCPPHYHSQEIFSHYPTKKLNYTNIVEITAAGRNILADDGAAELTLNPSGFNDLTSVRRLLEIANHVGPSSIADLTKHLIQQTSVNQLMASIIIASSLKYGFLRLEQDSLQ